MMVQGGVAKMGRVRIARLFVPAAGEILFDALSGFDLKKSYFPSFSLDFEWFDVYIAQNHLKPQKYGLLCYIGYMQAIIVMLWPSLEPF